MNSSSDLKRHICSFLLCSHIAYLWYSGITPCFQRITVFDCGVLMLMIYQRPALTDRYILLFLWAVLWVIHQENLAEPHDNCLDFQSSILLIIYYFIYVTSWVIVTLLCIGFIGLFVIGLIADINHQRRIREFGMENQIDLQQQSPLRLTPHQIVNLEQNFKLRYSQQLDIDSGICSICLHQFADEDQIVQLPICKHTFHANCIRSWFANSAQCPYCRNNIIDLV